ncbi:MAG: hypothetical protein ACLPQS_04780 [Acidimicrobiales bacterium]
MINILTAHWKDPKWIAPQADYLARNLALPYRVFASLEGINEPSYPSSYCYFDYDELTHAEKLNKLALVAAGRSDPADLLIFLDGDAFPVAPIDAWLTELLQDHPLAAVRRVENNGDMQPHPCFCVTTVGFWLDIEGDWRKGSFVTAQGKKVADVGGSLLHILEDNGVSWTEILRSNDTDLHPLWYAVYGSHIYHHGAGFRIRTSRVDGMDFSSRRPRVTARDVLAHPGAFASELRWKNMVRAVRRLRRPPSAAEAVDQYLAAADAQAETIFSELLVDPGFFRRFEAL